jgi:hypothetical protein
MVNPEITRLMSAADRFWLSGVPASLARQGPALGAHAGERRLTKVMVDDGGFTRFRRATQTPFNLIFEARP